MKQKLLQWTVLFLLCLTWAGCTLHSNEQVHIWGEIRDAHTQKPLNQVHVRYAHIETQSDEEGLFYLVIPSFTFQTLTLQRQGYLHESIPLTLLPKDGEVYLQITLIPTPIQGQGHIQGTVSMKYRPSTPIFPLATSPLSLPTYPEVQGQPSKETELLVRFSPGLSTQSIHDTQNKYELKTLGRLEYTPVYRLQPINSEIPLENILLDLQGEEGIEHVEINHRIKPLYTPNDPLYEQQWNLDVIGAPAAWQISRGEPNIIVAVLDTGVLLNHPDLKDNLLPGYNVLEPGSPPLDLDPSFSHGTHVAGIIASVANNGKGISGAAPRVSLLPIRILDRQGQGSYATLIEGIYYAVQRGARIINMSLGSMQPSSLLQEALDFAHEQGVILVAAAGNTQGPILYPAAYPQVLAVGAVEATMERALYSNTGPELDILAPGGGEEALIMSSSGYYERGKEIHTYKGAQGTSMAAPHVSAAAALLMSIGLEDTEIIRQRLLQTTTPLEGIEHTPTHGHGLLNMAAALKGERDRPTVFAARQDGQHLYLESDPIRAREDGRYILENLPPGTYTLYAWLDHDNSGSISRGDLFGQAAHPVTLQEGSWVQSVDIHLQIRTEKEAITLIHP